MEWDDFSLKIPAVNLQDITWGLDPNTDNPWKGKVVPAISMKMRIWDGWRGC
jgi:hypothetical protein